MRRPGLALLLACCSLGTAAGSAHADAREVTLRYGPVGVDGYGTVVKTDWTPAPGLDGYITRMHARVVDRKGRQIPVDRIMLHHVLFLNRARQDQTYCPGTGERFYGTGEENQWLRLPKGYGYPIGSTDRWRMNYMLMNHRIRYSEAFIEYTLTVDTSLGMRPVVPVWFGATGCVPDPIFNVPGGGDRGSSHVETRTWTAPVHGRLVAAAGHAHGGAKFVALSQPECGDRILAVSRPTYGNRANPVYNVLPVLHEPGPIDMSWTHSPTGIGIRKGDPIKLNAVYDARWPHTRAMGIMHAYFAPSAAPAERCSALPSDIEQFDEDRAGVNDPPKVIVPITGLDERGRARTIRRPPGPLYRFDGGTVVPVGSFRFAPRNLSIPLGASLTWRFRGPELHDVTLANGPEGFASPWLEGGSRFSFKFNRPGTYRLFCSLHPIAMTQRVVVRP